MTIRRLRVENFKCFREREWDFDPGVNVIFGPNESGKSSIREAILLALFGDATTSKTPVLEKASWGSDGGFKIVLEIEDGGENFTLLRDFDSRQNLLEHLGQETLTSKSDIAAKIAELVGTAGEPLYLATACITHTNRANDKQGVAEISERLRTVAVGGDDLAQRALADLDKRIGELQRGLDKPAVRLGEIASTRAEIERLKESLASAEAEVQRVAEARAKAAAADDELRKLDDELQTVLAVLEAYERRLDLITQLNEAKDNEKTLDGKLSRVDSLDKAIEDCRLRMKETGSEEDLADEPEIADKCRKIAAEDGSLAERKRRLTELEDRLSRSAGPSRALSSATIAALVIALAGLVATALQPKLWPILAIGSVLSLILVWLKQRLAVGPMAAQIAGERQAITEGEELIRQAVERDLQPAMIALKCETLSDLLSALDKRASVRQEKQKYEAELRGVLGERTRQNLEDEAREWYKARKQAEADLDTPEMRSAELTAEQYQRHVRQRDELQKQWNDLDEAKRNAEAIVKTSTADPAEVARLSESLESRTRQLEILEHRLAVYRLASDHIAAAASETLTEAKPAVEAAVGEYIARITNGRYLKAEVSVADKLELRLQSPIKDGLAEPDELSQGTADQLYLAARLGLIRHVFGSARPPLILDDPFVTFDKDRFRNSMALIEDFASAYQVLIFTCHEDYEPLGLHTIKL